MPIDLPRVLKIPKIVVRIMALVVEMPIMVMVMAIPTLVVREVLPTPVVLFIFRLVEVFKISFR